VTAFASWIGQLSERLASAGMAIALTRSRYPA
jgi:hypothetical protein